MLFIKEYDAFRKELDSFYAEKHFDLDKAKANLDRNASPMTETDPFRLKSLIYEYAATNCDVKVFKHCPFYYEIMAGRDRRQWGFGGIGGWMLSRSVNREYYERCSRWRKEFVASGLINPSSIDIDLDHHTIGYDNILQLGCKGIIKKCEARLSGCNDSEQCKFLDSVIRGYRSLIRLAEKFAEQAENMLHNEDDERVVQRLERIRNTVRRVPAEAPRSFYEALNTIIFMREAIGSLEGIAVSTYGMLDRMLKPFYDRDIQSGTLDHQEAKDLLYAFLAITDIKFDVAGFLAPKDGSRGDHVETSTTVIIGGCDAAGVPVYNEITEIILDAFQELRLVNPKLNARISSQHPDEYFARLGAFAAKGDNVLSIYNDEVLIPANVRTGKALEDCRLYVGGGCQENLLQNCAVHSRATTWLNLCGVLSATLFPSRFKRLPVELNDGLSLDTFEALYQAFLHNLKSIASEIASCRTVNERDGVKINPCPLHSATLDDCIARGEDWTQGGARYSDAALDCVGIGSLIDSLYALKKVVFDQKNKSLQEFLECLQNDYSGDEYFRQYLINRISKYGQDDEEIRNFSAKVFHDVAVATSGFENSRNGHYEASLFAFRFFVSLGANTMATADGRKAGQALSAGMTPSTLSLGEKCTIGQIFRSIAPINLEDYPIVGILDLKIPYCSAHSADVIASVIRQFLASGGSGLQINVVSSQTLKEAMENPESHPDLVVRISGYSAYFTRLPDSVKEEVYRRTQVN